MTLQEAISCMREYVGFWQKGFDDSHTKYADGARFVLRLFNILLDALEAEEKGDIPEYDNNGNLVWTACPEKKEPPIDLEKEMDRFFEAMPIQEHENIFEDTYHMIARHFYELGLRRAAEMYDEIEYNRQRAEED